MAAQITFVPQLIESGKHGQARYAEVGGELAGRGDTLAATEKAVDNRLPQAFVNLAVDRHVASPVDPDVRKGVRPGGDSHDRAIGEVVIRQINKRQARTDHLPAYELDPTYACRWLSS